MADISQKRRGGRQSLGERVQLKARVHQHVKDAAAKRAKEFGLSENDYITALIARDAGLTDVPQGILPLFADQTRLVS
jgi:hypothetical protein